MNNDKTVKLTWHKALDPDELPEGRVKTVTLGSESVCLTRQGGAYGALCNACPHQGGPLGEGSIENGLLRCPWHGWDFDPLTGKPPGGYDDGVPTYPVQVRDDGVYVGVEEEVVHERDVSDVMMETMANWGVKWCFGMVGHSNLFVADALRRLEEQGRVGYIGIRHEGAAAFACSAYGKLTGRPASCLAIAGPGATNLLTGLWDAHVDRSPVVALTGQVSTQVLGRHNFQELPLAEAFGQVAASSFTVLPGSPHAELMNLACKSAALESGVAHLVFPDEVAGQKTGEDAPAGSPDGRVPAMGIRPDAGALSRAAALLEGSKRPVIIVGHGARYDMDAVRGLAEHLGAPVLTTFKGKGLIADHGDTSRGGHPLGAGVLGRSGTPIASWFMNESDALLVLGASFSNHTGITPKKPTIQIDRDPMTLGKFHAVDCPVLGDLSATLPMLREALAGRPTTDHRAEVADRWAIWREEKASRLRDDRGQGVSSIAVFEALGRHCPADAVIAVDVGNNTYSFGRYFECKRQSVLMSGYLGSIGFGLPAAIGAWAATQEDDPRYRGRKVMGICGDGGLGQYLAELTTAVKYGMSITLVVLNNGQLGKISKEQQAGHWPVWQTALSNPSFAEFAKLCGAEGYRVTEAAGLDAAFEAAFAVEDGPSLVEIVTDPQLI